MAQVSEIEVLELQKRLLVARSSICRERLGVELGRIQSAAGWVPQAAEAVRRHSSLLLIVLPVAGWWLARRRWSVTRLAGRVLAGWQLVRGVQRLWVRSGLRSAFARSSSSGQR